MIEVVENPIVTSWSEIDTYRQCPFKHMLGYRERWSEPSVSMALQKGNLWHAVLEQHYLGIRALEAKTRSNKTLKAAVLAVDELLGKRDPDELQELIRWMYNGYTEKYMFDADWEIVEVEWKGFAPLPNPSGGPSRFMLKVKIDLIIRFRGRLWVVDHKSGKDLPGEKELDLDDQFGLYTWAMRQVGTPVMGSIHNAARTQRNKGFMELDTRMARTFLTRTDIELDTIAKEAYMTADKMWPQEFDPHHLPERTPNTDTCRWKCSFTEACLFSRKGGNLEGMLKAHGCSKRQFRDVELEWETFKAKD